MNHIRRLAARHLCGSVICGFIDVLHSTKEQIKVLWMCFSSWIFLKRSPRVDKKNKKTAENHRAEERSYRQGLCS